MVSKRKQTTESEASSKKKLKVEEKVNESPKKKSKKSKVQKEVDALNEAATTNDNEIVIKKEINEVFVQNSEKPNATISNSSIPIWPIDDLSILLKRIENILPQRETLTYKSRIEKINWNEISFGNYSGAECRFMWDTIQKRVRRYRILRELIEDAKIWIAKPWTNYYRGSKTNKHPDLPRRPLSSYMIFYLKKKDKVLEENPGLDMTRLSKHIAEMYKKLSNKSKIKYKELAAIQKKEYEEKMKEFIRLHPEFAKDHMKKDKAGNSTSVHLNAPPKPLTPFKLFYEDKLKRVEHEDNFDKSSFWESCKEQWRNLSDKKKVCWINWSLEKEAKYQEELKKYMAENPDYVPTAIKSVVTKEERTIKERVAGKPEKPPNSAYSLFSRLMLASENVKLINPKERMLLIAQQWKNCTVAEKKDYGDRVKHMLEQYKLQYAEYLESLPEDKRSEELLNNQPKRKTKSKSVALNKNEESVKKSKKKSKKASAEIKKDSKSKNTTNNETEGKKIEKLFDGEPEPPPATPYLFFLKSYQSKHPDRTDVLEQWNNLGETEKAHQRQILRHQKYVYIENYENFLKGLSQEELKAYSEWKKMNRPQESGDSSNECDTTDCEDECSNNSDDNAMKKSIKIEELDVNDLI